MVNETYISCPYPAKSRRKLDLAPATAETTFANLLFSFRQSFGFLENLPDVIQDASLYRTGIQAGPGLAAHIR